MLSLYDKTLAAEAVKILTSSISDKREDIPSFLEVPYHYYTGGRWTKHKRERDSQRQKVYDSETEVFGYSGPSMGKEFASVKELKRYYYSEIFFDDWFQSNFGEHKFINKMKINKTWGTRSRYYNPPRNEMRISKDRGFYQVTLIHELTHCIVLAPYAAHGPMFCAVYLGLLAKYMSKDIAISLAKEFQKNGVRFTPYEEIKYECLK